MDFLKSIAIAATGLRDSSMLTEDENIVDIRFTVQYRLKDARAFLFENRNPDDAVVQAAESAVREIVGRSKVPVIPMALRGLWGSVFTRDPGNLFERSFARGWRSKLALAVGVPVAPQEATPEYLYVQVRVLRGEWK